MIKNISTVALLGRSGSGKDTQAQLLVKNFDYALIGTGELLRAFLEENGEARQLAARVRSEIGKGNLAPTWLVEYLWIGKLLQLSPDEKIIFDGSPRNLEEAKFMDEVLGWSDRLLTPVLVDISEEEGVKRLGERRYCERCGKFFSVRLNPEITKCPCGGDLKPRFDDNPEAIKNRLAYFKTDVEPILEYYSEKGRLITVNGEQSVEDVYKELVVKLELV